jgi:PPM family protein phosphatase
VNTQSAYRSDIGRAREINEDHCLVLPDLGLFAVCDGMGGRRGGEVASRLVCAVLAQEVERAGPEAEEEGRRAVLEHALIAANQAVHQWSQGQADLVGMGATCSALLLAEARRGVFAHVGDSRLYQVRAGGIRQISKDHVYPAHGRDGSKNRYAGRLTRALGVLPELRVDTGFLDLLPGDILLLCTDGLHRYFPDATEMVEPINAPRLAQGVNLLINTALERGGRDNASALAVRVLNETETAQGD